MISLSHVWETMQHPDPLGFQLAKMISTPDIDTTWWFVDFMSLFQFLRVTPEQDECFRMAMQYMHVMYAHDDTWTFVVEELPSEERVRACGAQEISVFHWSRNQLPEGGEVGPVKLEDLEHNRRPYRQRGWCRAELEWSGTRSQPHVLHAPGGTELCGRAPLCPELFQQRVQAPRKFSDSEARPSVLVSGSERPQTNTVCRLGS